MTQGSKTMPDKIIAYQTQAGSQQWLDPDKNRLPRRTPPFVRSYVAQDLVDAKDDEIADLKHDLLSNMTTLQMYVDDEAKLQARLAKAEEENATLKAEIQYLYEEAAGEDI